MTRTRADENGRPTALMREYYVQRASAGLIVTECTAIRPDGAIVTPGAGCKRSHGVRRQSERGLIGHGRTVAARTMDEKMRVISQSELLRLTRTELSVLPRKIATPTRTC